MDARTYFRILRSHWRIILLLVVVCGGAAAVEVHTTVPTYRASVQMFVSTQGGDTAVDLQSGNTFTQARVASYAKIANSPLVLQPVISQLGLRISQHDLAGDISASASLNTVLMGLSVTNTNPILAARIANAAAAQFIAVIARIEQPTSGGATPVRVTITDPATVPANAFSPNAARDLTAGILFGLVLGVGVAVLRDNFDTTLRGEHDLDDLVDVPILARIEADWQAEKRPLVVQSSPEAARAESFRELRTSLQFLDGNARSRAIVMTSSIAGEGTTTATVNLAFTLASSGSTVAIIEGNLRRPQIAGYLGLDNSFGLTSVLTGQSELKEVLQQWGESNITVVASGPKSANPSELLASRAMIRLLEQLREQFEFVLIDVPPILTFTDATILSNVADGVVVLVGARRATKEQLLRSLHTLSLVGANLLGVVPNFLPSKCHRRHSYAGKNRSETQSRKPGQRHSNRTRSAVAVEARDIGTSAWSGLLAPVPAGAHSQPHSYFSAPGLEE